MSTSIKWKFKGCGQQLGGVVSKIHMRFMRMPPPITNPGSTTGHVYIERKVLIPVLVSGRPGHQASHDLHVRVCVYKTKLRFSDRRIFPMPRTLP